MSLETERRFEHRIASFRDGFVEPGSRHEVHDAVPLEQFGEQGWRVVAMSTRPDGGLYVMFEREREREA